MPTIWLEDVKELFASKYCFKNESTPACWQLFEPIAKTKLALRVSDLQILVIKQYQIVPFCIKLIKMTKTEQIVSNWPFLKGNHTKIGSHFFFSTNRSCRKPAVLASFFLRALLAILRMFVRKIIANASQIQGSCSQICEQIAKELRYRCEGIARKGRRKGEACASVLYWKRLTKAEKVPKYGW